MGLLIIFLFVQWWSDSRWIPKQFCFTSPLCFEIWVETNVDAISINSVIFVHLWHRGCVLGILIGLHLWGSFVSLLHFREVALCDCFWSSIRLKLRWICASPCLVLRQWNFGTTMSLLCFVIFVLSTSFSWKALCGSVQRFVICLLNVPNFNPASVTNEIQKLDPRKSPKKAPKPAFWTLPAKIREAFGNQAAQCLS